MTPVVETLNAPIVGKIENIGGTDLNFFLGVPYAKPPVDDLRFQLPQALDRTTELIEAIEFPARCMQHRLSLRYVREKMSEDCLYLNIVTPGKALIEKNKKYPVMVSILHRDYNIGSGNDELYLKAELVKRQNIILVTMNARLNVFGYATTEEEDSIPSNVGLWDENYALRWVKNNIEFFGGDPNALTPVSYTHLTLPTIYSV